MTLTHKRAASPAQPLAKAPLGPQSGADIREAAILAGRTLSIGGAGIWGKPVTASVADQILHLQRTAGNRAVAELLAEVSRPTVIQRKVSIRTRRGNRVKTKTKRGQAATDLLQDPGRHYYFNNKKEMEGWAKKDPSVDNMGYVEKEKAWVRVPENSFTVIGELHSATTMMDLAEGLRTNRFRYEAFTETARGNNPDLQQKVEERSEEIAKKAPSMPAGRSHEAEAFHPKALRGLAGIEGTVNRADSITKANNEHEFRLLVWVILDAKQNGLGVYTARSAGLDRIVKDGEWSNSDLPRGDFLEFISGYRDYAEERIKVDRSSFLRGLGKRDDEALKTFEGFDKLWQLAPGGDYDQADTPIMRAEKSRDFSMLTHIVDAKNRGDLFFGLGDLHRKRLTKILDRASIKHVFMDKFIEQQKQNFPQS